MKLRLPIGLAFACGMVAVFVTVFAFLGGFLGQGGRKQCQLIFGLAAEGTVTLEVVGKQIKVRDRQGSRSFDFSNDALPEGTTIPIDVEGAARYTITSISRYQVLPPQERDALMVDVRIEDGEVQFDQYCDVELRPATSQPAIGHFDGPLAVSIQTINGEIPKSTQLSVRGAPLDLRVQIGTIDHDRGCWTVVRTHKDDRPCFGVDLHPSVQVEFEGGAEQSSQAKIFPLDKFC